MGPEHQVQDRTKSKIGRSRILKKFGTDFDEVFAPVARGTTFRTLLKQEIDTTEWNTGTSKLFLEWRT